MERMINIEVAGNRARASSRELGTQGEVAAVTLALSFDGGWDGLTKRLLWRSASGEATGYTLLTAPGADGVYAAAVPALPLSEAGRATLTVEGVAVSGAELVRRVRSVQLGFRVEPNDLNADSPAQAVDPTVAEQLAAALDGKAAASHTHVKADVTDFAHTHAQGDVTGLTSALAGKAASSHTHEQGDVTGLASALAGKAASSHTHAQGDVAGLASALAGKAASAHTHTKADITDFAHTHAVDAADVTYSGGAQADVASALDALDALVSADRVTEYSGALTVAGWNGASAPYTQSFSCQAVTANSHVLVGMPNNATDEQYAAACGACLRFVCGSKSVTATAYGVKPAVALPVRIGVIK